MLPRQMPKRNPQSERGAWGFRPSSRAAPSVGEGAHARAGLRLARRHCAAPLPFGPIALHVGVPGRPRTRMAWLAQLLQAAPRTPAESSTIDLEYSAHLGQSDLWRNPTWRSLMTM